MQSAYQGLVGNAQNVAATPYQSYTGELTAPVNQQEQAGIGGINQYANAAQPYLNAAAGYANSAAAPITQGTIQGYENPEASQVTQATLANFNELNAQQNQNVVGNAISSGAWGGDRASVAQAELARQQAGAEAPTLANINLQSYNTGLQTALTEQQQQAQAAYSLGNIGQGIQSAGLTGAGAQIQGGQLQQGTQQQLDQAKMQQYYTAMGYPFQTAAWLAGIEGGIGGVAGGTSSTTAPAPNPLSSILGLGAAGAGAYFGAGHAGGGGIPHFDSGGGAMPYSGGISFIPAPQQGRGGMMNPSTMLASGSHQPSGQQQQGSGGLGNLGSAAGKYFGLSGGIDTSGAGAGFPLEGSADAAGLSTDAGIAGGFGSETAASAAAGLAPEAAAAGDVAATAGFSMADLLPLLAFAARGGRIPGLGALHATGGGVGLESAGQGFAGYADGGNPRQDVMGRNGSMHLQAGIISAKQTQDENAANDARMGHYADGGGPDDVDNPDSAYNRGLLAASIPLPVPRPTVGYTGTDMPIDATDINLNAGPGGLGIGAGRPEITNPALQADAGIRSPGINAAAYAPTTNPYGGISNAGYSGPSYDQAATRPQDTRSLGEKLSLPLMQAGFAMMASRSPFLGEAIGQGGLSGIGAYLAQEKERRSGEESQQEIGLKAKQLSDLAEQHRQTLAQTEKHQNTQEGFEQQKINQAQMVPHTVGVDTFGKPVQGVLDPKSGTYVDPLTRQPIDLAKVTAGREAGMQSTAHMIANYALPPISPMKQATPEGQMLMRAVEAENPAYNATFYNEANKARSAFVPGAKAGDAVRSYSTGISHLDVLSDAADALGNNDTRKLNQLKQYFQTELGLSTAPTTFDAIKPVVAAEITKAIVGGNMTEGDRQEIQAGLKKDLATMNIKDVIDKYKQLMGGQLTGYERGYRTSTHGAKDFEDKLSPAAVEMLHKAQAAEAAKASTAGPAATTRTPTQGDLDYLKAHPEARDKFVATFGAQP